MHRRFLYLVRSDITTQNLSVNMGIPSVLFMNGDVASGTGEVHKTAKATNEESGFHC